jgi:hypothetical protein
MLALQPLTTIPEPEIQTWYYIFMTALADSGHVPQNNFPFNNFRSTDFTLHIQAFGREPNALPLSYRGSSPFCASYAAFSSDESSGDMICNAENEGQIHARGQNRRQLVRRTAFGC